MFQIAIILDDIIDDVDPWSLLAGFLKEQGAKTVYAMAPHGILSGNAHEKITNSKSLDQVIITNTGSYFKYHASQYPPFENLTAMFIGFI